MGVCQSTMDSVNEALNEDPCFAEEENDGRRVRENKKTGEIEEFEAGNNQPENDEFLFEEEEVKEGEQFMAVKPWIGAVVEPDSHPDPDPSPPDVVYDLEYAYGYRCQDSRQNVFYNGNDEIVYMTACLGVVLNRDDNVQRFFGGGEVDNSSKQVSSSKEHHNNDIMCLDVNTAGGRTHAVTG